MLLNWVSPGEVEIPFRGHALIAHHYGNGLHVVWNNPVRRHEIIIVGRDDPFLSPKDVVRIRAFAKTLGDTDDRKRCQRRFEAMAARGALQDDQEALSAVREVIGKFFASRDAVALQAARDDLRAAVLNANKLLASDEIETICHEALVESVLKS